MSTYQWTKNGQVVSNSSTYIATQYGVYTITATDFCVNTNTETVKIAMEADCNVWAGDCNHDGKVDEKDWLAWGLMFGDTGVSRSNTGIIWEDKICPDWKNSIDGINSKHGDANGDGIVNFADTIAIVANFGRIIPNYQTNQSDWDGNPWRTKTKIISATPLPNNKLKVTLDIYLKDKNNPNHPVNIHGFSSKIKIKTSGHQYFGANANLSETWLGTKNQDFYTIQVDTPTQQINTYDYRLAMTRKDKVNRNGIEVIAKVSIIIDELIIGNDHLELRFLTNDAGVSTEQLLLFYHHHNYLLLPNKHYKYSHFCQYRQEP